MGLRNLKRLWRRKDLKKRGEEDFDIQKSLQALQLRSDASHTVVSTARSPGKCPVKAEYNSRWKEGPAIQQYRKVVMRAMVTE